MLYLEHFGTTHAGKVRQNNEDSLLVGEGRDRSLFAVADGIGGFEAGEVASSIAIDALREMGPADSFEEAIREANRRILDSARRDEKQSGMGTTVVAARFGGTQDEPTAEIAHVGDSRMYLLRDGDLRPITEDHSLVAELVRSGDLTRAQAAEHPQKNLITRALGADEDVQVDTTTLPVKKGDRFILCSDGLSDMVPEPALASLLVEYPGNPETTATRLLDAALDAGGMDNITVIVVDVKDRDEGVRERAAHGGETQQVAAGASSATATSTAASSRATSSPPGVPRNRRSGDRSNERGSERRSERRSDARRRSRGKGRSRVGVLAKIVRGLAILLVIAVAATPVYLWGASQYYLGFDGDEVVIYNGLPEAYTLGFKLNQEVERTGLRRDEIKEPYRDRISSHELRTREEAENIVRDLRS
jgi:protein phosphatase